jgi:hypothetical protein
MRHFIFFTLAAVLTASSFALPIPPAEAKHHVKEWRGADGRLHCRKRDGTIGLVVGGVAGALVGRTITVGTVVGAGAGALIGRKVARGRSCR